MDLLSRILVTVVVVGTVLAAALQLDRDQLKTFVGELWFLPAHHLALRREWQRSDKLEVQQQLTHDVMEQKGKLARQVVAGQMSLRQAASRFGDLSKNTPYFWDHYQLSHPDWPAELRYAKYVIDLVEDVLRDENKNPTELVKRLWAEFGNH
jgi:hypothetical protein